MKLPQTSRRRPGGVPRANPQVLAAAVGRRAVWAVLALLVLGVILGAARQPAPPPAPRVPEPTTDVEAHATAAVRAWLEADDGDEPRLRAYFAVVPDLLRAEPERVAWMAPGPVVERGAGYWAVTVMAGVGQDPPQTRWFQVGVRRVEVKGPAASTGRWAYVSPTLPAEVGAPPVARSPRLAISNLDQDDLRDDLAQRVQRFLTALLTGEGDVNDFTSPGATVLAVQPPPFRSVDLRALGQAGMPTGHREVLAEILAEDAAGHRRQMHYPLELTERDGRWEVVRVLEAPTVSPGQPPPADPTARPAPSSTTTTSSIPTPTTTQSGRASAVRP